MADAVRAREETRAVRKSIGWDGKTLKEMREEVDALTRKTGHYAGLTRLEFKESDPITFEKLYYRLRAGVVDARETAKRVAASPIVEQEGELTFTVYTPDGDGIVTSTGIIIHVGTMGAAIKYMIANDYEVDPGIEPGDIFCNNDPHVGNIHTCDVHTLVPIFYNDELVAWASGVTHVIETGASSPGSMPTGPVTRFGDGYYVTCRKVGRSDTLLKDWLLESQRAVRTTKYWTLDERTRLAGCFMIRDLVLSIIDEFGLEAWKKFSREVIEDGRRQLVNRLKAMTVPGRYRQVSFVDVPYGHPAMNNIPAYAKVNTIMHAPSEIVIRRDGTWEISTVGSNRWGWHPYNGHPVTYSSGIWVMMTQTLIPNERINDGAMYATRFNIPRGSWIDPRVRITAHNLTWLFLMPAWSALWRGLSRAYFARGYLEEVNAGNAITTNILQGGGVNQYGEIHAMNSFEMAACGVGAGAVRDGIDHAAAIWNPEGDMADMETWEYVEPMIYLGRAVKTNSGGYGKYRGGCGHESLRMIWKARDWTLFHQGNGYMHTDCGLMGGYPSAVGYRWEAHKTDLKERIEEGLPIPLGGDTNPDKPTYEQNVNGEIVRDKQAITSETLFQNYDLVLNYIRGGPGFGDPIERDPKAVELDIANGYVLPEYAEKVYGVVLIQSEDGRWKVDEEATKQRRQEIRQERLRRGVPTRQWMEQERARILAKDASIQVRHMWATTFSVEDNKEFTEEFRKFWNLPPDWSLTEEELSEEVPMYGHGLREFPDDLKRAARYWPNEFWREEG